jgi:LPS O-antigen subunit length determinant protein (WzzB/FepE family)
MVDQVQNTMSNVEQYRMVKNILTMWESYRMTVLYVFGALLILTIVLFVMKNSWKKTVLFLTILAGLTIAAFDGFKMYVDYKKQEAKTEMVSTVTETVETTITTPANETAGTVKEGFGGY